MSKTHGPQHMSVPTRFLGGLKAEIRISERDPYIVLTRVAVICLFLEDKGIKACTHGDVVASNEIGPYLDKLISDRTNGGQKPFELPKNYTKGDGIVAEVEKRETSLIGQYLDFSWLGLSDEQRQELRDRFNARVLKALNGGSGWEVRIKEIILQHVARMADEVIAHRTEEIRAQVEKEVDRRWSEVVESIVAKKLADAVAKIKAEMAR